LSGASRRSALTPVLRSRRGRRMYDRDASSPVTRQPRGCAACLRLALVDPVGSSGERRGDLLQAKPGVIPLGASLSSRGRKRHVERHQAPMPLEIVVPALGSVLWAQAPFAALSGPVPLEGRREPQLASLLRSKLPQGVPVPPSDRKRSSGRRATLSAHKGASPTSGAVLSTSSRLRSGEQKA